MEQMKQKTSAELRQFLVEANQTRGYPLVDAYSTVPGMTSIFKALWKTLGSDIRINTNGVTDFTKMADYLMKTAFILTEGTTNRKLNLLQRYGLKLAATHALVPGLPLRISIRNTASNAFAKYPGGGYIIALSKLRDTHTVEYMANYPKSLPNDFLFAGPCIKSPGLEREGTITSFIWPLFAVPINDNSSLATTTSVQSISASPKAFFMGDFTVPTDVTEINQFKTIHDILTQVGIPIQQVDGNSGAALEADWNAFKSTTQFGTTGDILNEVQSTMFDIFQRSIVIPGEGAGFSQLNAELGGDTSSAPHGMNDPLVARMDNAANDANNYDAYANGVPVNTAYTLDFRPRTNDQTLSQIAETCKEDELLGTYLKNINKTNTVLKSMKTSGQSMKAGMLASVKHMTGEDLLEEKNKEENNKLRKGVRKVRTAADEIDASPEAAGKSTKGYLSALVNIKSTSAVLADYKRTDKLAEVMQIRTCGLYPDPSCIGQMDPLSGMEVTAQPEDVEIFMPVRGSNIPKKENVLGYNFNPMEAFRHYHKYGKWLPSIFAREPKMHKKAIWDQPAFTFAQTQRNTPNKFYMTVKTTEWVYGNDENCRVWVQPMLTLVRWDPAQKRYHLREFPLGNPWLSSDPARRKYGNKHAPCGKKITTILDKSQLYLFQEHVTKIRGLGPDWRHFHVFVHSDVRYIPSPATPGKKQPVYDNKVRFKLQEKELLTGNNCITFLLDTCSNLEAKFGLKDAVIKGTRKAVKFAMGNPLDLWKDAFNGQASNSAKFTNKRKAYPSRKSIY